MTCILQGIYPKSSKRPGTQKATVVNRKNKIKKEHAFLACIVITGCSEGKRTFLRTETDCVIELVVTPGGGRNMV